MQVLTKVDAKINVNNVEKAIKESLPTRNYDNLNQDQRRLLFMTVKHADDEALVKSSDFNSKGNF